MKRGESQIFASPEEALAYLEHHGVKGMRWGVRKEDDLVGRMSSSKVPPKPTSASSKEAEYNKLAGRIAAQQGIDSREAMAKYGPPSVQKQVEKQRQADHEKLKKIAIAGGITIGAAAAGVAIYKINQAGGFDSLKGVGGLEKVTTDKALAEQLRKVKLQNAKVESLLNTRTKAYVHAADGLAINWENGVELPKGSIIRRLSTVAETTPRPEGFFGAYLDNDVQSYKAILPNFWSQWGMGDPQRGGFLNHYQAKEAIRAPSGKESVEMFKELLGTNPKFKELARFYLPNGGRGATEEQIKQLFVDSSSQWAYGSNNGLTREWFAEAKKRGYNAFIDFNDAGKLGKTPLRVFDGTMFEIVKNEPQSLDDFYNAAKNWAPELVHFYMTPNGELVLIHVDDFIRRVELGKEAIL